MTGRKYINYLTTNLVNDMIYIGVHLNKKEDPYEFDGYFGSNKELKADVRRLGRENFKRETLFVFDTKEEAKANERILVPPEFVVREDTYNKTTGGGNWPDMTSETRRKIGNKNKGNVCSKEHRRKIGDGNKGKVFTEEHKRKIGDSHRGNKSCNWGKHLSEEQRQYLSEVCSGWHQTEEVRKKISEANSGENHWNFGKVTSEETKEKIRESTTGEKNHFHGKHHSEESKKLMSLNSMLPQEIIDQRRKDIENEPQTHGYKSKLARKWGTDPSWTRKFIENHASDLITGIDPIVEQRREDIKNILKVKGYEAKLAKMWRLKSITSVIKFINKYASDLI